MARNFHKNHSLESKPKSQEWGCMEWLMEDSMVPESGMSVAFMILQGEKTAPRHRHPNCNEFIYVIEGCVEITMDGKAVILNQGDSVMNPAGTIHSLRNPEEEDVKMMVAYSEGERIYEEV